MSKRPPFLGYNHNVRHKGRLFHVQTEDSGLGRPVLTTHVFIEGTILATLRAQYTTDEPDPVVQKRMQEQHKTMLKRVRDGEFDSDQDAAPQGPLPESAQATQPRAVPGPAPAAAGASQAGRKPAAQAARAGASSDGGPPLSERQTGEILRPVAAAQEPAGQKGAEPSALAARLGINQSGRQGVVPPPLIGGAKPGVTAAASSQASPAALNDDDVVPMVEMDAQDSDDDEPQVTIEAAEPSEEEAEAAELSKATPLPVAAPMGHDETFIMGAADLIPPPRSGPFTVSVPLHPTGRPGVRPVRGTRPVAARQLHSGALRARATSEGVVVLCLGPARSGLLRRPKGGDSDPMRTTQPNLRPTMPAPLAPIVLMKSLDEPHFLDEKLMTFLRREAARKL